MNLFNGCCVELSYVIHFGNALAFSSDGIVFFRTDTWNIFYPSAALLISPPQPSDDHFTGGADASQILRPSFSRT